jgi:hypothetical protein
LFACLLAGLFGLFVFDAKQMGKTWGQLERLAQNPDAWKELVGGLCPRRDEMILVVDVVLISL